MKIARVFAVITLLVGVAGCASTSTPVDPNDESVSLVYGYFDMTDAPASLDWLSLKQYGAKQKESEWYHMAVHEGTFMHVGVEPGSYQIDRFGGMGGIPLLTRRPFEFDFGSKGRNETAIRIKTPGTYFLGSFKYIDHSGGLFKADKFEMKVATTPSEKEILTRVIERLETDKELKDYTRQLAMAKRRLATLN